MPHLHTWQEEGLTGILGRCPLLYLIGSPRTTVLGTGEKLQGFEYQDIDVLPRKGKAWKLVYKIIILELFRY